MQPYSERLKEIMALIVQGAPKAKILAKARQIKDDLSATWLEAQRTLTLLDGMISTYAPDKDWIAGFSVPPPSPPSVRFIGSLPQMARQRRFVTRSERVQEVAKLSAVDGKVAAKTVAERLRAEGDERSEKVIAIAVGNVLVRHGWERTGVGQYRLLGGGK